MTKGLHLDEPGLDLHLSKRPSLATALAIIRDPLASLPRQVFERDLVISPIFGRQRLFLAAPPLIHEALVRHAGCVGKGGENKRVLGPALGNGLLTANGASWKWQRQTLAPAFQMSRLQELVPAMITAAEATRDAWLARGDGANVDLGHDLMRLTFDIILETMLSGRDQIDAAGVERSVADYLKATNWMSVYAVTQAPAWLPYPGKRRAMKGAAFMRAAVQNMVARRRTAGVTRQDLVALLLAATDPETGRAMSDTEITDNLLTFLTAGHETTALALSWTLALLAAHPEIEARAVDEIAAVTKGDRVEARHIDEFVYLKQIFNESMRLYPPAPIIFRAVIEDFDLSGYPVKAGTVLVVPIYAVHRHAKLWDRPEMFDPARFEASAVKARHRLAFLPFGAGNRVCIGTAFATMEAVAILAVLLQAVRLERTGKTLPAPKLRVTLRPADPLNMRVFAR